MVETGAEPSTHVLSVINCPDGIIRRPQEDLHAADVKTQKLLTIHGGFPPKSSTLRFYKQYKEGGRGLVSL